MRCWGSSTPSESRGLQFERSECAMDSRIFISGSLQLGHISVQHEAYDGRRLGSVRFLERYSRSFRNESFGGDTRQLTAPQCHEQYVAGNGVPLRAVMCVRAYKKLAGLYDMSLLVALLDSTETGAQGRMDASGVSFENAQKLAAHYLAGFGVDGSAKPPRPAKGGSTPPARPAEKASAP